MNVNNADALRNEDEAYDALLGGDFGSMNIMSIIDQNSKDKDSKKHDNDEGEIEHLPDAIDFEDEDELVSDFEDDSMNESGNENAADNDTKQEVGDNLFEVEDSSNNDEVVKVLEEEHSNFLHNTNEDINKKFRRLLSSFKKPKNEQELKELQLKTYFPNLANNSNFQLSQLIKAPTVEYGWQKPTRDIVPIKPTIPITVQADSHRFFSTNKKRPSKQITRSRKNVIKVQDELRFPDLNRFTNKDNKDVADNLKDSGGMNGNAEAAEGHNEDGSSPSLVHLNALSTDVWNVDKLLGEDTGDSKSPTGFSITTLHAQQVFDEINNESESDSQSIDSSGDTALWNDDDLIAGDLSNYSKPIITPRDERIHLEQINEDSIDKTSFKPYKIMKKSNNTFKVNDKIIKQRFNISNDATYDLLRKNYKSQIRTNVGTLNIQHSTPASKLQVPFYKSVNADEKTRFAHKQTPFFDKMRPGSVIGFSKIKNRKRRRDKGKDVSEIFEKTSDLTLGDSAPVFLLEYSEQNPSGLSKFGMNTKIVNYYRKKDEDDQYKPKQSIGENIVLGTQDKSPFWNYGQVLKGEILTAMFNNMIRAPIVPHKLRYKDYLLVKSQGGGVTGPPKYFLRKIDNLYTVGQTMPVNEYPGPNTRKMNSIVKNRLKLLAYKLIKNSPTDSLTLKDIKAHFKDSSDLHLKTKLKEFMKFYRYSEIKDPEFKRQKKSGTGYWKLKESETLPDDEQMEKLITPEDVAMQDQVLEHEKFLEDNKLFNIDEEQVNLEEQLAPWNTSKNFINSTNFRTTVAITGEGDPTGLGEGFNLLRSTTVAKKDSPEEELYNSLSYEEQKKVAKPVNVPKSVYMARKKDDKSNKLTYEEEMKRVWYRQQLSISIENPYKQLGQNANLSNITHFKKVPEFSSKAPKGKVMKFVRKKKDANGIIHRETQYIKDPSLIHAYIAYYENLEASLDTEQLLKDDAKKYILGKNDQEKTDKLHAMLTKKLSEVSKRSIAVTQAQAIRRSKKEKKNADSNEATAIGGTPTKERKVATRTCKVCGQVGHIKTSKICPMYQSK
jgi:transcription initiation factor TFIID subunit 1, fungi type